MERAGVETGLHRFGETGPCMLLSHCSLAYGGVWKRMLAELPPVQATAPDLPGHGCTPRRGQGLVEEQAASALVARLDAEGPAHLVGHSYGGRVVLRAALTRPELALSVTAVEPMMFHLLEDVGHPAFADEIASSAEWGNALRARDADTAGRAFTGLWGNGQPWESIPERQRGMMAAAMPIVLEAAPEVMGHPPGQITLADIAGLPCPVTLIAGAKTRHTATAICEVIAANSHASFHQVPSAGHMVPLTHPRETAALIAPSL